MRQQELPPAAELASSARMTLVVPIARRSVGLRNLPRDEAEPTNSFKARGLIAVSMAKAVGGRCAADGWQRRWRAAVRGACGPRLRHRDAEGHGGDHPRVLRVRR
jgi:hypothetical protein